MVEGKVYKGRKDFGAEKKVVQEINGQLKLVECARRGKGQQAKEFQNTQVRGGGMKEKSYIG